MDYAATHPEAKVQYKKSDMILHVQSDASYLSAPRARSRAGGFFFLSSHPVDPSIAPTEVPTLNGPIHTVCKIMKNVVGSAAEAEIGAAYINCQEAVPMRTTLEELGHPQPSTPVQLDNSTASGFANDTIKQKRSKAIDMRYYWLQDRVLLGEFLVYWRPGSENIADYLTKHHSPAHHRLMRGIYLYNPTEQLAANVISCLLRGCVNSTNATRASLPRTPPAMLPACARHTNGNLPPEAPRCHHR